jgi:hypothetical protein
MFRAQAIWYVYELADSKSGEVFYVGKGKGSRINDHEWEAKTGYASYKCNKIRSIWADGGEIIKRKVAQFWDEDAAYEHEKERINEIGFERLTNLVLGGRRKQHEFVNAKPQKPKKEIVRQEICMSAAWQFLEQYIGWFVLWLRRPFPDAKMVVENLPVGIKKTTIEILVNKMVPMLWKRLVNAPENHARLEELFLQQNIKLVFERETV